MACRTARLALDLVFLYQSQTDLLLVGRRLPGHVEHLVAWPDVPLRIPVTFQAPAHLEGLRLPGQRHPVDLPMASRAADALLDVDAVVEVDEVAQDVDPIPLQRLTALEALADRLQHR